MPSTLILHSFLSSAILHLGFIVKQFHGGNMAASSSTNPTGIAHAFSSRPHKLPQCFSLALNVSDIHLSSNFCCSKNLVHSLARLSSHVCLDLPEEKDAEQPKKLVK